MFGIRGAAKVELLTDFVERFDPGETVLIEGKSYEIDWTMWHKGQARVRLEGFDRPEDVQPFIGKLMEVPKEDRPELDEDEYYAGDLVGMEVVMQEGRVLGPVDELISGPAQDLLRIGDVLIPMVKAFVKEIDLENRRIRVELIPGFLPGEDDDV